MGYKLKKIYANLKNFGGKRKASDIKYIVIHYTANKNDKAESNGNYFKNNAVQASAHYFVDETTVVRSVKDKIVAWSVGGNKYPSCESTGGGKFNGKCTNSNSISIELCNSLEKVPEKTLANAIKLTKKLMKRYKIDSDHIIRHFDVTGKECPKPFVKDALDWERFKLNCQTPYKVKTTVGGVKLRKIFGGKVEKKYIKDQVLNVAAVYRKGNLLYGKGVKTKKYFCLKNTKKHN